MAEDVASRVAGAEALLPELRERVERAAARFGSIHERWSTSEGTEPAAPPSEESTGAPIEDQGPSSEDDALPLARDAVRVTPILGIDTDDSDEAGRPRFKTLMGVPRSSPELDELAGLDSGRHDTRPIERTALRPPAASARPERASPRVDEAPSLAGTSLPSERSMPPASSASLSHAPWPSLAHSALDVSAEVAALRTSSRRRWAGVGTIAAAVAIFAVAAPHQRTLALRWLESEYHARLRPTAAAISDSSRALRPGSSAATSPASTADRVTAQLEPPRLPLPPATGEPAVAPAAGRATAGAVLSTATGSTEDSSEGAADTELPREDLARDAHALGNASRAPAESSELAAAPASAPQSRQAGLEARPGGTKKVRSHVAAARKPVQRADHRQTASATKMAGNATKAHATRQNAPRKDSGGGIIRETPF